MDKMMIGVDVAKEWVDIAVAGESRVRRIENCEQAIDAWLAEIGPGTVYLVAFEPTGGYERVVRRCLNRAKVAFAQVHPNEVVAFRRRRGIKAKTDRIDAKLLAAFAAEELARRELAAVPEADELLRELTARRRQLQTLLHAETCRRDVVDSAVVRKSCGRLPPRSSARSLPSTRLLPSASPVRHTPRPARVCRHSAVSVLPSPRL